VFANKSKGGTPSVVKMLVERAKLSIYVGKMGPNRKKAVWGQAVILEIVFFLADLITPYNLGVFNYSLTRL
jgi:hypothetical protein